MVVLANGRNFSAKEEGGHLLVVNSFSLGVWLDLNCTVRRFQVIYQVKQEKSPENAHRMSICAAHVILFFN